MRFEEGVGCEDFGADVALDGGFELGFCGGGESDHLGFGC